MSLLEVKKKIEGVKSTKKITKAMQLVAASKMRAFQKKALSTRAYVWKLLDLLGTHLTGEVETLYTHQRTEGKTVFVLYTSDKGLCGGLNTQLQKALVRSRRWIECDPNERILVTIGKKAAEFARINELPTHKEFTGVSEKLSSLDALAIIDDLLALWHSHEAKEILFVVPHYKNSFTFYPRLKTFLPFSADMIGSYQKESEHMEEDYESEDPASYMIFEPSKHEVLEKLYEQLIESAFIQSFFELKASEYSSRMIAMQSATDAAEKKVGELTLIYNKTRQQVITQQLAEIVGAGEAISS